MKGLPGWGLFALLAAIIALYYMPSEQKQKEMVLDQVVMGAPAMMPAFARTIHIQKDVPLSKTDDLPLYNLTYLALWKGEVAHATCLPVSLPVQATHIASPVSTARETYKATAGLHAPRNRVLLFWNDSRRGRLV